MGKKSKQTVPTTPTKLPTVTEDPPEPAETVSEAPALAEDLALGPIRPGPRVTQLGSWLVPKVTGADVDIRRATDNAIRLVKESFSGKKELSD